MESPEPEAIAFESVSVTAEDGRPILSDLSLTLTERRVGLIGANGAGKSTFLRLINGLACPTQGRVVVDGLPVAGRSLAQVRRRVGFLFQTPDAQIVMPTPAEDIAFGLKPLGLTKDDQTARIGAVLDRFGLTGFEDRPAFHLSGGEKQRLALAAVVAPEPALLVMDEPTTQLDLAGRRLFGRMIAGLSQRVILATHDLDLIAGFDRVLVLEAGRLVFDGPPDAARAAYEARVLAADTAQPLPGSGFGSGFGCGSGP